MISKHKIKYKDGTYKTNVRIVEGYRPGPGMAPKQRQIKNLGYAEDYEDQDAFWKMVEEEERKFKESKESIEVQLDPSETLKDTKRFELGYKYLDAVYDFLEIDKFLEALKVKVDYDYKKIFRYLVTERILHADSIRSCFQKSKNRYGYECDFQYHQIIRCLDLIEDNMEPLQRPMFVHTDDHIRAHFMICFTALLIVRLIGFKLGDNQISVERIQRALASFGCEEIAKGIIRLSMSSYNNEYIIKKDEEGNEYSSLLISDNNETIEDLIKLQNIARKEEYSWLSIP